MPTTIQLREAARQIFAGALHAVDAREAIRRAIVTDGSQLRICQHTFPISNRPIYSIAIGKAATAMGSALSDILGNSLSSGLLCGPDSSFEVSNWKRHQGGHPLPTEVSLAAASEAMALLDRANQECALIIFLVSGGGSAMMEWPANDKISLDDLKAANKALVNCGASIGEINSVRRAFSAIKGGKLAARAPDCDQITLIISDVPAGQEWNVASGPTLEPPRESPDPRDVIDKYGLRNRLPGPILRELESQTATRTAASRNTRDYFVLLDNQTALDAAAQAAREQGFITEISPEISDQSIETGSELLIDKLEQMRHVHRGSGKTICLISGGEFACPVRGNGIGGRNLETALRLAGSPRFDTANSVALCAGTDGIDGNSPAAGAIVDHTTVSRARAIGVEPRDFLERSNSYSFFTALGDVVSTGRTGTNVRDVRIILSK